MSEGIDIDRAGEVASVRLPIRQAVGELSRNLTVDRLGSGPLAEIRRMDTDAMPPPAFWGLLFKLVGDRNVSAAEERGWAMLMQAMALQVPRCHRTGPGTHPGRILADSGYPESRFVRLLRAEGAGLAQELRTLARWTAGKALVFDWTPLAEFILARAQSREGEADHAARALARHYFRSAARAAQTPNPGPGVEA